jgi:hypothetical protein
MPELPRKKVGLIACSGEDMATCTLSRAAVRLVLEALRPDDTVTLCLPLFLAGENEERSFARVYPTVAVDGCEKLCARRATDAYSAPVAGSIQVDRVLQGLDIRVDPAWRRELDDDGWAAAHKLADVIATHVDAILGPVSAWTATSSRPDASKHQATCSCGSGLPVAVIEVAGRQVELTAVPALFEQFYDGGARSGEAIGDELLRQTEIYNRVPAELRTEYRAALIRAYEELLNQK